MASGDTGMRTGGFDERDYPPVLDAAQVAHLLGYHIDYVRKLSREKVLPAHQLPGGRSYRYLKDELLEWLRDQPPHGGQAAGATEPASAGTAADPRQGGAGKEPAGPDAVVKDDVVGRDGGHPAT